jgi:hypothetical protein
MSNDAAVRGEREFDTEFRIVRAGGDCTSYIDDRNRGRLRTRACFRSLTTSSVGATPTVSS